ncbi:uncharacterized protein LOC114714951 [Neltuma alba]|uniref:uncharacterized protein LOC114714951 n=1 Tax=Neltuma alba TaxID=207710 RepID=UPI0010A3A6D1|nr:uncharacterized protein LOC114714951 [Prosopis alba]XP_028755579.1 uncharacterized protein LOC114714951 [Prosopis alba]
MKMETQVATCYLTFIKKISCLHHLPSNSCMSPLKFDPLSHMSPTLRANTSSRLRWMPIPKSRQSLQICLAGGRGMMENNNEDSPWKGRSIEEVLQQLIEKQKYDNGSSGVKPPRGGGGGGSGGSGEGGFAGKSNETLQVVLATIGFLFLYIYVLTGEELTKLARDYLNYLYSGRRSVRLKRAMFKWERLCQGLTNKVVDRHWLEKAMLKRNYLLPKSNQ